MAASWTDLSSTKEVAVQLRRLVKLIVLEISTILIHYQFDRFRFTCRTGASIANRHTAIKA